MNPNRKPHRLPAPVLSAVPDCYVKGPQAPYPSRRLGGRDRSSYSASITPCAAPMSEAVDKDRRHASGSPLAFRLLEHHRIVLGPVQQVVQLIDRRVGPLGD